MRGKKNVVNVDLEKSKKEKLYILWIYTLLSHIVALRNFKMRLMFYIVLYY